MAGVKIILYVFLCSQFVVGQLGLFAQRGEHRVLLPLDLTQNILKPNGLSNTLSSILSIRRPSQDYVSEQNRPIINNEYYPNRPIYNNKYDQNRPINKNQNDPNLSNNNQCDQSGQINNQKDQNHNRPNDVNLTNQVGQNLNIPTDNANFEQSLPTNNSFVQPKQTNSPNYQTGYGLQHSGTKSNQKNSITNFPTVNVEENSDSIDSRPTFAPLDKEDGSGSNGNLGEQFNNTDTIHNVTPPQIPINTTEVNGQNFDNLYNPPTFQTLPMENDDQFGDENRKPLPPTQASITNVPALTDVPDSEMRNNFGAQEIFKEPCTTVEGTSGNCVKIALCEPYIKLIRTDKSNSDVQVLKKAHCGFEGTTPKVCCPLATVTNVPILKPTPITTASATAAPPVTGHSASEKFLTSDFLSAFPVPPECGVSNASLSKVVGGVDAKLGDFPWMALLGYQGRRGDSSTSWRCGGSLISVHHVLTAAHCIHTYEDDLYLVRLGELDIEREDDGAFPIDIRIKYKIKHEGYNLEVFSNDIGLLILEKDVQFTDLIRPICIPTNPEMRANSFVNYNPMIAGWGNTGFRGPSASHLQVLQLPVVSNEFCAQAYVQYKTQVIDERVLCAGYKEGGKDACKGDSGGPLMQPMYYPQDRKSYFFQIGVISYGRRCADAGFPGVYSRVTSFVPWLERNMLAA